MITKIHDKYFDLSNFVHPGGNIPLCLADCRDGTELFESHHLFSDREKILMILKKYEVHPDNIIKSIETNNNFDWNETLESDFTKELMHIINSELKYRNIKASYRKWLEISGLFLLYLINLYYYYQSNYFAMITYPLSLWLFTVNIYHDASHFALSHRPLINKLGTYTALMFSLTYCWYHQHIIGHHCYVNIMGKDPDLYHSPLYIRHTPDIRGRVYHKYQHITAWFIWLLAVPVGLIYTGFSKTKKGLPYNKVVGLSKALDAESMYWEITFVIIYMFIIPYIITKKIIFVVYPYLAYSILFMLCTQINHLTEDTFETHKNFFIHQIINSHNVAPKSYLTYIFTGGLNLQIEHHLVPSVNHCHLAKLQPKIELLCKKYNVKYNKSDSIIEAIYKHYKHLFRYAIDDS